METIENLDSIRPDKKDPVLEMPGEEINIEDGPSRIPILFLVDVSGTMNVYKDEVNDRLKQLVRDVHQSENGMEYMVDLAVITFGNDEVKVRRPFGLLRRDESITIGACGGDTPLGNAMLQAYYYASRRKQAYQYAEIKYNQPVIILISDLKENGKRSAVIDGRHYSSINKDDGTLRPELFEEMAELYNYAHLKSLKQFTYFVGIGEVDPQNREKLEVASLDGTMDLTAALDRVVTEYLMSAIVENPPWVQEATNGRVIDGKDMKLDAPGTYGSSEKDWKTDVSKWQKRERKINHYQPPELERSADSQW